MHSHLVNFLFIIPFPAQYWMFLTLSVHGSNQYSFEMFFQTSCLRKVYLGSSVQVFKETEALKKMSPFNNCEVLVARCSSFWLLFLKHAHCNVQLFLLQSNTINFLVAIKCFFSVPTVFIGYYCKVWVHVINHVICLSSVWQRISFVALTSSLRHKLHKDKCRLRSCGGTVTLNFVTQTAEPTLYIHSNQLSICPELIREQNYNIINWPLPQC